MCECISLWSVTQPAGHLQNLQKEEDHQCCKPTDHHTPDQEHVMAPSVPTENHGMGPPDTTAQLEVVTSAPLHEDSGNHTGHTSLAWAF